MENYERLAVLETQHQQLMEDVQGMSEKLDILIANMNKMKGFWAGAVAAGTALGAVLGALISYIFHSKLS